MRRARPPPVRVGSARGPTTPRGDRAHPRLGAGRGHDDAVPSGGRPRDGRGPDPARAGAGCRVRRRPGGSRRARGRPRARRRRLRHQGRSCGCAREGRASPQDDASAAGSATSSRTRSASWCSTTSGCATTSAGRRSTAERLSTRSGGRVAPVPRPLRLHGERFIMTRNRVAPREPGERRPGCGEAGGSCVDVPVPPRGAHRATQGPGGGPLGAAPRRADRRRRPARHPVRRLLRHPRHPVPAGPGRAGRPVRAHRHQRPGHGHDDVGSHHRAPRLPARRADRVADRRPPGRRGRQPAEGRLPAGLRRPLLDDRAGAVHVRRAVRPAARGGHGRGQPRR